MLITYCTNTSRGLLTIGELLVSPCEW